MSLVISLSVILRPENTGCRNRAENRQIVYKNQLVDDGNPGHLFRAKLSHHDVIQKADEIRDRILYNHGQCQI